MGTEIRMRAIAVLELDGIRKVLPGQCFTTSRAQAAQLLREGVAVFVDERDIERVAGREAEMRRGSSRRLRGHFGGVH